MGDGYLCFFGHNEDDPKKHALNAFLSAVEIQEFAIEDLAKKGKARTFPMRIGIHTDKVIIGNLGGDNRNDYTMIGEGVNFASRLEAACNTFRVTLSQVTYKLLDPSAFDHLGMYETHINIKHHDRLIKCFEYSPLFNQQQSLQTAEIHHFEVLNKSVNSPRYPIPEGWASLEVERRTYVLKDFSIDGFGAIGKSHISPKTSLDMTLKVSDSKISELLSDKLLTKVKVEVKWSRKGREGSFHGFKIVGLNSAQKALLHDALLNNINNQGSSIA